MTKYDKILIGAVLAVSLLTYMTFSLLNGDDTSLVAEISVNGTIFSRINLNNPPAERLIKIPGPLGTSIAEVKPGAIRMKSSPCPDHDCMQSGWIDRPAQLIVCVPNQIIIRISADKQSVDAISY